MLTQRFLIWILLLALLGVFPAACATQKTNPLSHAEQAAASPAFLDVGNLGNVESLPIIADGQQELVRPVFQHHGGTFRLGMLDNIAHSPLDKAKMRGFDIGREPHHRPPGGHIYIDI